MGLLIKVLGDGAGFAAATNSLRVGAVEVEPILTVPPAPGAGFGAAPDRGATWLRVGTKDSRTGNPWDDAHQLVGRGGAFAAAGGPEIVAVEPDVMQGWDYKDGSGDRGMAASAAPVCVFDDQKSSGGTATMPGVVAWNAAAAFSQFAAARAKVGAKQGKITIAHLDTGFDPAHRTRPAGLVAALQRNFVAGSAGPNDATDHAPAGTVTSNRGHGTATLSLLAGNKLAGNSPGWPGFADFVGGAPVAEVIPVRIADWVVRFTTSTMVQGFDYARSKGAHVLSMSMGGLSSSALVDAVNLAYDAGRRHGDRRPATISPSPRRRRVIVFPARYRRVLAACGVMADGRAYAGPQRRHHAGQLRAGEQDEDRDSAPTPRTCRGPRSTARNVVDMDGAGTSAATPQIAAAAALWLAEHWDTVKNYSQPWMRIEAVRHALFATAAKSTAKMDAAETLEKIGQGVVKADAALAVMPRPESQLRKLPPAEASWSWLDLLIGGGVSLAAGNAAAAAPAHARARADPDGAARRLESMRRSPIPARIRRRSRRPPAIATSKRRSTRAIRRSRCVPCWRRLLGAGRARHQSRRRPANAPTPIKRKPRPLPPPGRRLRVYALDPSVAKRPRLRSPCNEATLTVPWDDQPRRPIRCGPARSASISKWSISIRRRTASTIRSTSTTRHCSRRTACRRRRAIRSFTSRWSMPSP